MSVEKGKEGRKGKERDGSRAGACSPIGWLCPWSVPCRPSWLLPSPLLLSFCGLSLLLLDRPGRDAGEGALDEAP